MSPPLFERSGLASLADFDHPEYTAKLGQLAQVEREFLSALPRFAHPEYKWHRESLHTWSRAWEYPYVLHHVAQERRRISGECTIVDFGSGSCFFPFAVARLGAQVRCFDNDPVGVADLTAAVAHVNAAPGAVVPARNEHVLPCETGAAAIAYSVSVLEHMPDPLPAIDELARVLRPGGLLVLTLDLDVEGSSGVTPAHFEHIRELFERDFTWEHPERVEHPLATLTSKNSPWPRPGEVKVPGLLFRDRSGRLRPLIGGPNPGILTVYGCVLRRN